MRIAESVTFGGGGIDRAAHLRSAAMENTAQVLPLWRGKPLSVDGRLAWLQPVHPMLADAGKPVFLGVARGASRFARDLSAWQPDEVSATVGGFSDRSEQRHPEAPGAVFVELRNCMTGLDTDEAELAATARALLGWHSTHGFCARCGSASTPADGGWQRLCPACGARHFPRTDPVAIMLILHGNSVLLGRSPGWPEGMYSLLAGFVEPGETVEAAVRRETLEEAGVEIGRVTYLASQPWPYPSSLMIGCRGEALGREIRRDPAELDDAIWLTREELLDAFAGLRQDVVPARPGAIARFLLEAWLADRLD